MEDRTLRIIAVCKGGTRYNTTDDIAQDIINYLSEECYCEAKYYTTDVLESILVKAMLDYVDACHRPSSFMRAVYQYMQQPDAILIYAIVAAFRVQQVMRRDGSYCNGFDSDYSLIVEEMK